MPTSPVSHLDILSDEQVADYLTSGTVPLITRGRITPDVILSIYIKLFKKLTISELRSKGHINKHGLVSLQEMVRYNPSNNNWQYPPGWLILEADDRKISSAAEGIISKNMQYLEFFPFSLPGTVQDAPTYFAGLTKISRRRLLDSFSDQALVATRKGMIYIVDATWTPVEEYSPDSKLDSPCRFVLSHLNLRNVDWQDQEILRRITEGDFWNEFDYFVSNIHQALSNASDFYKSKQISTREIASILEELPLDYSA